MSRKMMELKKHDELVDLFAAAISFSIQKMGVDKFKETSFFGSNEMKRSDFEEAA